MFLDRDGILNELVIRDGVGVSPRRVEDFRLRDDAILAVSQLRGLGFRVFVATNQPDVARGLMEQSQLTAMTERLYAALPVDEVVVCPHDDRDECRCRKPKPGMLLDLAERWRVVLTESFLVGDSWKDIEAGRRAGCRTILVGSAVPRDVVPDHLVPDFRTAADTIGACTVGGLSTPGRSRA